MSKQEKREYKRQHRHHQHQCKSQYPPRVSRPNTSGQSATFPVQAPDSGGVTVGMAALVAMAGLGTLLIVRRRWVFRTHR